MRIIAPNVLSGEQHMETCVYDGVELITDYVFTSIDESNARQLKSCSQCGVKYDLPVTREEWVDTDSVTEKFREGYRRVEEQSA